MKLIERMMARRRLARSSGPANGAGAPRTGQDFYLEVLESLEEYGVFTMNAYGNITSWNRGASRVFGFAADEILGRNAAVIFTPEDVACGCPQSELDQALAMGKAFDERWHVRKGGGRFWGSGRVFPLRDSRGRLLGFTKIVQDLTARKLSDDERRAALNLLRFVTDNVPALIAYMDADMRYTFVNIGYERWFDRPREEIVGRTVAEIVGEKAFAVIRADLEKALSGEVVEYDRDVPFSTGARWVHAAIIPDRVGDTVKGVVGLFLDITENKKAETALKDAQQRLADHATSLERKVTVRTERLMEVNRELESFTYSASHDLRAPLRKIDAFSHAVLEHCGARMDDYCKRYFGKVRESTRQMHRLIDDMLILARVTQQSIRSEEVDLSELAVQIAGDLARMEPQRRVEFHVAQNVRVQGDPSLWAIALRNLLDNAWKFTRTAPRARVELGTKAMDGAARALYVRDNGAGFEMERSDRLFEPFERLHRPEDFPGTGVGLAIVRRAVERQGGKVWAEGSVGKGATFYISLQDHRAVK